MSCLDEIIKVGRDCEGSAGKMTLEDIGIYLSELNDFVTSDYKNGRELGEAKIASAIRLVENSVAELFRDSYKVKSIIDSDTIGHYNDTIKSMANTEELNGIQLELCNDRSYIDLYINEVYFFSPVTINTKVFIFDVTGGKLLDEFDASFKKDCINTVEIGKTYRSYKQNANIAILVNTSSIDSVYESSLTLKGCSSCRGHNTAKINRYINARGIYVNDSSAGVSIADTDGNLILPLVIKKENIRGRAHTSGLSVDYSIQCNHSRWLCSYKNKLVLPIAYKAGMEIMKYALFTSDRMNSKTTIDSEKLQARLVEYENEYERIITNLTSGVRVPNDRDCFVCKEDIRSKVMLP